MQSTRGYRITKGTAIPMRTRYVAFCPARNIIDGYYSAREAVDACIEHYNQVNGWADGDLI